MDDAFRNSGIFDKAPAKTPKEIHTVKKEDVDVIVSNCCAVTNRWLSLRAFLGSRIRNSPNKS